MTKYLITGGAGFVGSHLIDKFINEGNSDFIVFDDLSAGNHNVSYLKKLNVDIRVGKIESLQSLESLPRDLDTIIHLAAMNRAPRSIKDPVKSNQVNIDGTLNILEFARKVDSKVIFASSSSVFGHLDIIPRPEITNEFLPSHPYGLGKLTSEHYCRLYNELYDLDTRIIRYFAVYGPRQSPKLTYSAVIPKFINAIINNKKIDVFGGNQTRNFTFVKNTVDATYKLSTKKNVKNRVFNVGGSEEISINKLITLLEDISGKKIDKEFLNYAKGDIFRSVPYMNNLKEEFGYIPIYSFYDGLKETYKWFINNQNYFMK